MRRGAFRDAVGIVQKNKVLQKYIKDISDHRTVIIFKNGSIMEFVSYANSHDAQSGKRDYLFLNEGNGISKEIYKELAIRTAKKIYIDYNPTARFWAHEMKGNDNVAFFRSYYIHNPYADPSIVEDIERSKHTDPYFYRVMGLGLTGQIAGVIFKKCYDIVALPSDVKRVVYGLDFGYSNDPTALVKMCLLDGDLHGEELIYDTGLLNSDLIARLEFHGVNKKDVIVADRSSPQNIAELKKAGYNVVASSGNRINFGINKINEQKLFITTASLNWWVEQQNYIYHKKTGEPIKTHNHIWDAARYAAEELFRKPPPVIKSGFTYNTR